MNKLLITALLVGLLAGCNSHKASSAIVAASDPEDAARAEIAQQMNDFITSRYNDYDVVSMTVVNMGGWPMVSCAVLTKGKAKKLLIGEVSGSTLAVNTKPTENRWVTFCEQSPSVAMR